MIVGADEAAPPAADECRQQKGLKKEKKNKEFSSLSLFFFQERLHNESIIFSDGPFSWEFLLLQRRHVRYCTSTCNLPETRQVPELR